jgi:hypothetical protein
MVVLRHHGGWPGARIFLALVKLSASRSARWWTGSGRLARRTEDRRTLVRNGQRTRSGRPRRPPHPPRTLRETPSTQPVGVSRSGPQVLARRWRSEVGGPPMSRFTTRAASACRDRSHRDRSATSADPASETRFTLPTSRLPFAILAGPRWHGRCLRREARLRHGSRGPDIQYRNPDSTEV